MSSFQKQYSGKNQEADRIGVSPRMLEQQRWRGDGSPYIKVGRRVLYDPERTD